MILWCILLKFGRVVEVTLVVSGSRYHSIGENRGISGRGVRCVVVGVGVIRVPMSFKKYLIQTDTGRE